MANAIYPLWKEEIMQLIARAGLDGSGATGVNCVLVDLGTYTYSAAHEDFDDLSGIVDSEQEVGATKTFAGGVFDGADIVYTAVTGDTVEAIVLYVENAGASSTHLLFLYLDTSVTGLPVTPNGGDITITWNGSGIVGL
jgi:hypothetical protein